MAARNYRVVQNEFDKAALHEPPPEARAILQLEVGWLRWFLRLPSSCAHRTPTIRQLDARVAELVKVRAQVALAEANIEFKEAQMEFLEFGGQPSGGDLGDVVREALARLKDRAVVKKIKELKKEFKTLKKEKKELEYKKIKELEEKIKELEKKQGEERRLGL